jgi:oxygen-independent coproporphyrinogen-3 oxidase
MQFKLLHEYAQEQGFDHYEISNLALPGKFSRHNSNYWNNVPYLGLGPSAHSFDGNSREWNCSDTAKYINSIKNEIACSEKENLALKDRLNDYLLTKLRTRNGIDLKFISTNFGEDNFKTILNSLKKYSSEHATITDNSAFLTLEGWFISDRIIGDLMI